MIESRYVDGDYGARNPTWHAEDSPWKAQQILRLWRRNHLAPGSIGEVGCGAGEVLRQLQQAVDPACDLWGYDVSPDAIGRCQEKANEHLHFKIADATSDESIFHDLLLLIDVVEHVADYMGFLRAVRPKGRYKILHIPLEISVQSVLRVHPILRSRRDVGHLHYFTKETAFSSLEDCGYEIVDWFFTAGTVDLPARSVKSWLAKVPRRILFGLNREFAVRVLGGFSVLVLAQ
jgi:SAM-dependent methyltransferase